MSKHEVFVTNQDCQKGVKVAASNYKNLTGTKKEAMLIYTIVREKESATDERRNARNGHGSFEAAAKHNNQSDLAKWKLKTFRQNNI